MTLSKRSRNLFLLLLLSLALYAMFNASNETSDSGNSSASSIERPSAFTTKSEISSYNGEGLPYLTIKSNETLQYSAQKKVTIFAPNIDFTSDTKDKYSIVANKGYYFQPESLITLEGEVSLRQKPSVVEKNDNNEPSSTPLTLTSEKLSLDLAKRFISTDQAVKIERGPHTLHAVGMEVLLDRKILTLHNQVRGHYVTD